MATRRDPAYAPDVVERTKAAGGSVTPQIAGRPIVVQIMLNQWFEFHSFKTYH